MTVLTSTAGLVLTACLSYAQDSIQLKSAVITVIDQAWVPARQAGVLGNVRVKQGQVVRQGAVLAQIDDQDATFALKKSELELDIARKKAGDTFDLRLAEREHAVAVADLQRARRSREKSEFSISESDLDRLQLKVVESEIDVERFRHGQEIAQLTQQLRENELNVAKDKLAQHKITAPFSGVVVEISSRSGEWVKPGDRVLRMIRVDRVRAEGFLHTSQVRPELDQAEVMVAVSLPGQPTQTVPGKIVFVSPEVDPYNGDIRIFVELDNRQLGLRPGSKVNMDLKLR